MLDAHTDEVGFMVRAIRPNGLLDFVTLGGWVPWQIPAHRVRVRNRDGEWIPGVTSAKPPHYLTEADRKQTPDVSAMTIDLGASSAAEVRDTLRVGVGAPVVPDVRLIDDPRRGLVIGKAFDDRLGCAALLMTLESLAGEDLGVNITAAFAAQEEAGLRGATVTAQVVKPDLAICFEGCPADDTLDTGAVQTALGKGPMLRHYDMRMITNPRFQRLCLDIAEREGIPVQEAVRTGGATNGGAIHLSGKAVPTVVLGIPVRYIHSHEGIANMTDLANTARLARAVILSLSGEAAGGV